MKSLFSIVAFLLFVSLNNAIAEPTCKMSVNGSQVSVTIADTGLVWSDGQKPPAGWTSYPGTGREGDIAASCSDNESQCASASWYLRFADANQGWPSDSSVDSDPRVVKGRYLPQDHAITYHFSLIKGMATKGGSVRMHYSAKVGDQVVAAYQPQDGCLVDKGSIGGHPHTVVKQP